MPHSDIASSLRYSHINLAHVKQPGDYVDVSAEVEKLPAFGSHDNKYDKVNEKKEEPVFS